MTHIQQLLDLAPRPKLRLSEIERLIRKHRIIVPPPSRRTLIGLCDAGTLETLKRTSTSQPWIVYEDSFLKWVREMDAK